jgi:chromosomal replication initiation ATPase DnaA
VTAEQLILDLPHRPALGAEDFLVSDCNLGAVRLIDAWPGWQNNIQLLIGPAASGKTHLVRVWQVRSDALAVTPAGTDIAALDFLPEATALVVEDIDRFGYDEKWLFHLLNLARERSLFLLMTSRDVPNRLEIGLPDLESRLNALPAIRIGAPDDTLLKTVMLKHFSDRQLSVEPKVLDFLALHIDRSLAAAALAVAAVDRAALASGNRITRQLVSRALAKDSGEDDESA